MKSQFVPHVLTLLFACLFSSSVFSQKLSLNAGLGLLGGEYQSTALSAYAEGKYQFAQNVFQLICDLKKD